eukprot:Opistho-1_new@67242
MREPRGPVGVPELARAPGVGVARYRANANQMVALSALASRRASGRQAGGGGAGARERLLCSAVPARAGPAGPFQSLHETPVPVLLPRPDHLPAGGAHGLRAVPVHRLGRVGGHVADPPLHRRLLPARAGHRAGRRADHGPGFPDLAAGDRAPAVLDRAALHQPAGGQEHLLLAQELRRLLLAAQAGSPAAGGGAAHAGQRDGHRRPGHAPEHGRPAPRAGRARARRGLPAHGLHDRRLHRLRAAQLDHADRHVGRGSHALLAAGLDVVEPRPGDRPPQRALSVSIRHLDALFAPASVAVIGASTPHVLCVD